MVRVCVHIVSALITVNRRGRRDGRMMGGKRGYPYNRPRYNYGDQGQPLRRQRDYTSR